MIVRLVCPGADRSALAFRPGNASRAVRRWDDRNDRSKACTSSNAAHTTDMTLTASSRVPEVGDRVWGTATLTNEGCGRVGLPEYRLSLVQAPHILVPDSPTSVTHHVALEFGEMDVVTFSLQTLGVGEVVLQASTSLDYYHA